MQKKTPSLAFTAVVMACLFGGLSTAKAQTFLYPEFCQYADWAGYYGAATAADFNNDGYCDLIISGFGRSVTNPSATNDNDRKRMSHVLLIDPTADMLRWTAVNDAKIGFNVTDRPSLTPCDINRDGLMDLVTFETVGHNATDQPYTSGFSKQGIFLGNGDGTFTAFQPTILDEEGLPTDFDLRKFVSGTVCDVNNDGLLDIVGIGYQIRSGVAARDYETCNYILVNLGNDTFQQQNIFADGDVYHFEMAWIQHYDLNNDGLQDLIISGQSNDNAALGRTVRCLEPDQCVETHFFDVFLNSPASPGTFTRQYLQDRSKWGSSTVWAIGETGCSIGDVDSDGVPDLYLVGYCGDGRKHDIWGLFRATLQDDGSVKYDVDYSCPILHARPLNTTSQMCGFIDWDGDGNLDYYAPGWYGTYNTQTAIIYTNEQGDGTFSMAYRTGSGSELSSCFVDWNADGIADLLEMGQSWDGNFFLTGGTHFQATLNPNKAPVRPEKPQLGQAETGAGSVTLAWEKPESAKGNVTFEYWVKDANGRLVTSCNAHIGGALDGKRKTVGPGNACQARKTTLHLPKGSYTYGIQTVDGAYQGSEFATGSFEILTDGIAAAEAPSSTKNSIYNTGGQRLSAPQTGVNIINRKKYVIKK
ncbi:MAG: VCBS repeat-containing protein [Prevotella sp.]|nr:VCBS repeat-containing protein [Prevotella sp.]